MKKYIFGMVVYTLLVACACFAISFFALQVPELLPNHVFVYKVTKALEIFFKFLPSVILTSFLLSFSLYFGKVKNDFRVRFSATITKYYRLVIVVGIILTALLSLSVQVCCPWVAYNLRNMESSPRILDNCLVMAQKSLKGKEFSQAAQFAKRALIIDPKNVSANNYLAEAEEQIQLPYVNIIPAEVKDVESATSVDESKLSVFQLISKSEEAYSKQEWFNAHYYAQLAVDLASPQDINLVKAKETAAKAWERISSAQEEQTTEDNIYFRKKRDGYIKLQNGDFLKSYYIFAELENESNKNARDPDVVRYLDIARKRVKEQYFFIDETYDLERFETSRNMRFSIKHMDKSYDIVTIEGITEVEGTGNFLRYLRNFQFYRFDPNGVLLSSIKVPYAKMLAYDAEDARKDPTVKAQTSADWKYIPYLLLTSVDRLQEGIKNEPKYTFYNAKQGEEKSSLFLPIPYEDFDTLISVSEGVDGLNLLTLSRFIPKASYYGYSSEVIYEAFLFRIAYPFMLLIFIVFFATLSWNYRLRSGNIFKFKWILVWPFLNFFVYVVIESCIYVMKLLNYSFIGIAGSYAIFVGLAFELLLLIFVSIGFLARVGD